MANYYMNEAVFDLPERPFLDKTIHGLDAKLPGDKTLGVLVHRRPADAGKTLRQLVDENIAVNKTRLSAFAVLEDTAASVGGVPGFLLRTKWRNGATQLCQLQAHVLFQGQAMIFAVGAPLDEQAVCDETFASLLETITWRTE